MITVTDDSMFEYVLLFDVLDYIIIFSVIVAVLGFLLGIVRDWLSDRSEAGFLRLQNEALMNSLIRLEREKTE